jgi:hypothetical protein
MSFPSEYPSKILQNPSCLYSVIQSEAKDFGNIHRLNSFFCERKIGRWQDSCNHFPLDTQFVATRLQECKEFWQNPWEILFFHYLYRLKNNRTAMIKEELTELLKMYYNGPFVLMVCVYIHLTGMTE